ncbi:large ribosomal subunit protein mL55-like [Babylonia areolata]|uniref:large ribosomal subunit protein mL55-like n=1 Tax=Babylonia areolata TaxID=304850 RepID=UPI003FD2DF46
MSGLLHAFRQGWTNGGLCQSCRLSQAWCLQRNSSSKTIVTRMNRRDFPRMYPTVLALPDGSTINVRYTEPRKLIKLPEDLSLLSEAERKLRLQRRKPKQKLVIEDDLEEETFDASKYSHLWKK